MQSIKVMLQFICLYFNALLVIELSTFVLILTPLWKSNKHYNDHILISPKIYSAFYALYLNSVRINNLILFFKYILCYSQILLVLYFVGTIFVATLILYQFLCHIWNSVSFSWPECSIQQHGVERSKTVIQADVNAGNSSSLLNRKYLQYKHRPTHNPHKHNASPAKCNL